MHVRMEENWRLEVLPLQKLIQRATERLELVPKSPEFYKPLTSDADRVLHVSMAVENSVYDNGIDHAQISRRK